jgi:hypothetical protein
VFGVSAAHVFAYIGIRTRPETGNIHSCLHGTARWRQKRDAQGRFADHWVGRLAKKLLQSQADFGVISGIVDGDFIA